MRLYAVACSDEFDGYAAANNVDLEELSTRRLLNLVWHYLTSQGTKASVEKLKADLLRPLPGMETVTEDLRESEMAMFTKIAGKGNLKGL